MKRRGFLGFLGGAAVAGPAMAKQAAQTVGIEAMALPSLPFPAPEETFGHSREHPTDENYNHGDWLRDRIASITGISAQDRYDRISRMTVTVLDPDLACNRSMALWAKIHEQKVRNYERGKSSELRGLQKELVNWIKQQGRLS